MVFIRRAQVHDPRYSTGVARQPSNSYERTKKKAPDLQQVKKGRVKPLAPEHVEVASCRADELAQRRGLTSELEARWSAGGKQAEPRWLWHAIAHYSGTV